MFRLIFLAAERSTNIHRISTIKLFKNHFTLKNIKKTTKKTSNFPNNTVFWNIYMFITFKRSNIIHKEKQIRKYQPDETGIVNIQPILLLKMTLLTEKRAS